MRDRDFVSSPTSDVDRPYKKTPKNHDLSHLPSLSSDDRPYWQFDELSHETEQVSQ